MICLHRDIFLSNKVIFKLRKNTLSHDTHKSFSIVIESIHDFSLVELNRMPWIDSLKKYKSIVMQHGKQSYFEILISKILIEKEETCEKCKV